MVCFYIGYSQIHNLGYKFVQCINKGCRLSSKKHVLVGNNLLTRDARGNTLIGVSFDGKYDLQYCSKLRACPNLEYSELQQKTIKGIESEDYFFKEVKTVAECLLQD